MKTFIKLQLIAVLLSATLMAGGQPFTPVISSDSTTWDVAWKELFGNLMGRLYTVVSKDSMYHDLYFEGIGPEPVFAGKTREDATNGKLWYSPPENGKEEFLIMDLTLNVGDVFDLPIYTTFIPVQVVNIYYADQKKHIEFDFPTQWGEPLRFIEGVGRNIAMFNFWFGEYTYVACKYNKGELFYMNSNPNFEGCALNTSSIGESFLEGIVVYPNPCDSYLDIKIPVYFSEKPIKISVYNIYGEMVFGNRLQSSSIIINTETLAKGIYFLFIQIDNQILITTKFLKQ
jgi:hypothetical protein